MTSRIEPVGKEPSPILVRTHALEKSFGNHRVLRGVDLQVREGAIYGFLGRNGAGKTTAIQILMGIQKPNRGWIQLFGEWVKHPTINQKRHIGYVSQEQFFYPWMTCRSLGRFVGRFYPDWDGHWFDTLMGRFDLPKKRKIGQLSQGMRVKLALALALAPRPRVLILDEPTAGLDPAARREFLEILGHRAAADGLTTFFSTHIVEEVDRIANRIGILASGRLRYQGNLAVLKRQVRRLSTGRLSPKEMQRLVPAGMRVLNRRPQKGYWTLMGPSGVWEELAGRGHDTMALSLEDIFLSMTVEGMESR